MRRRDRPLMGAEEPPLEQRDHPVDPWQQFGGERVVASQVGDSMTIAVGLQTVVPVSPVGVNVRAWLDRLVHEAQETVGRPVRNPSHANPPDTAAHFLGRHDNHGLVRRRPPVGPAQPANEAFVDFHIACQPDRAPAQPWPDAVCAAMPRRSDSSPSPAPAATPARWCRSWCQLPTTSRGTTSSAACAYLGRSCPRSPRSGGHTRRTGATAPRTRPSWRHTSDTGSLAPIAGARDTRGRLLRSQTVSRTRPVFADTRPRRPTRLGSP